MEEIINPMTAEVVNAVDASDEEIAQLMLDIETTKNRIKAADTILRKHLNERLEENDNNFGGKWIKVQFPRKFGIVDVPALEFVADIEASIEEIDTQIELATKNLRKEKEELQGEIKKVEKENREVIGVADNPRISYPDSVKFETDKDGKAK